VPAGAEVDGGGDSGELVDDLELARADPGELVLVIGGVGLGDVDEEVEGGVGIAIEDADLVQGAVAVDVDENVDVRTIEDVGVAGGAQGVAGAEGGELGEGEAEEAGASVPSMALLPVPMP
jgi:hypothetical protein